MPRKESDRIVLPIGREIATGALALITDPARFSVGASARDIAGQNTFSATDGAVQWSCLGAVARVAVLEHTRDLPGWRSLALALRERGIDHHSSHAEAVAALKEMSA